MNWNSFRITVSLIGILIVFKYSVVCKMCANYKGDFEARNSDLQFLDFVSFDFLNACFETIVF